MGKGKKQPPDGLVFLKGVLLSLGIYLLGQLLVTLLVVKGTMSEKSLFPTVAALCVLAALGGALLCARRPLWGPLPSALGCAALFAAVLAAVGILSWGSVSWTGHGGVLILCALGGGVLAGLLGGGRRGRRRRKKAGL